jgi:hypothetical protein
MEYWHKKNPKKKVKWVFAVQRKSFLAPPLIWFICFIPLGTFRMEHWYKKNKFSKVKGPLWLHSVTSSYTVSHYHTQCHIIIHSVTSSYIVSQKKQILKSQRSVVAL